MQHRQPTRRTTWGGERSSSSTGSRRLPPSHAQGAGSLKPGGVLFSSNPRGENQEGWNGPRYGSYHDLERWRARLTAAGFVELEHYYRPAGQPRDQQPWLASVWRRVA